MTETGSGFGARCPEMAAFLRYHEGDSIFVKDMDGRFVFVSETKARNSGVTWQDMIGKTDFDFLPKAEAQKSREDEICVMETGESIIDQEEKLTRPDGTIVWVSVSKSLWRDIASEEILGIIGIARDITEKKKMDLHMALMVSFISHEVKGTITAAAADTRRLLRGKSGNMDDNARNIVQKVYKDMVQIEKLIGGCLIESSLRSSERVAKKEVFDLRHNIINPLLENSSQEREERNIKVDGSMGAIPEGEILVSANKVWLLMVYRELFLNAIKHTPDGGRIAFGFEDKGNEYHLNVFNTGKAILPEKRESIFEMFESESSSGIGLHACREFIRRHGGDLIYRETLDGYPNFIIILPKEEG